jgi:hypothetical protein
VRGQALGQFLGWAALIRFDFANGRRRATGEACQLVARQIERLAPRLKPLSEREYLVHDFSSRFPHW